MIRRLLVVWHARNLEFIRDRATLIFTLLLPISLVVGMGFVFGGPQRPLFKVGVLAPVSTNRPTRSSRSATSISFPSPARVRVCRRSRTNRSTCSSISTACRATG